MNRCAECNREAQWRDADCNEWCDEHRHSFVALIQNVGADNPASEIKKDSRVQHTSGWKATVVRIGDKGIFGSRVIYLLRDGYLLPVPYLECVLSPIEEA